MYNYVSFSIFHLDALKRYQFWLLWFMLFIIILNCTLTEFRDRLLSQLSPMIQDIFGKSLTDAAVVVSVCSGWNAAGRLLWTVSDYLGLKHTFAVLFDASFDIWNIPYSGRQRTIFALCYGPWHHPVNVLIIHAFLADLFGHKSVHGVTRQGNVPPLQIFAYTACSGVQQPHSAQS